MPLKNPIMMEKRICVNSSYNWDAKGSLTLWKACGDSFPANVPYAHQKYYFDKLKEPYLLIRR